MTFNLQGCGELQKKLDKISSAARKKAQLTAGFYEGATYEDGTYVAQVAFWNNNGTLENGGFIPPRPFFSETIKENKGKWSEGYGKRLVKERWNVHSALAVTGEKMASDIQQAINDYSEVPNAEATIEKKGRNAPLKDTYHMMNSVGYSVNDEPPQYRKTSN